MRYYEVWISSSRYHRDSVLTYGYEVRRLTPGSVVVVPLKKRKAMALVAKEVNEPKFEVKTIIREISRTPLPNQLFELIQWMKDYYPAPLGQLMTLILPSGLTNLAKGLGQTQDKEQGLIALQPELTSDQRGVISSLTQTEFKTSLLHGDTGTGKTRVYLELVKEAFSKGKSALLLTPEIGLTPQLAWVCESVFPGQTVVIHSDITPARRRETWLKILESKQPIVVVGARSALFAPARNLGLIAIDEFHEAAYKQEQSPRYLTSRVAGALAKLHSARLILGSATPTIADYYMFTKKKLPILRMTEPALRKSDQEIDIIDLKNRARFTSSSWISDSLINAIDTALKHGEQSLLFLNRRGTARMILCQNCAWQAACPNCDVSLVYHGDTHKICCHICGFIQKTPTGCPECSNDDIVFRVIGTKSLVAELERLFPGAKIARFDSDSKKDERLEFQYEGLRMGGVDILVGTQILGKGLDLPRLSTLGVILADASLSFPDHTAEERTFQLLTQVIGRVNRGHLPGKIYIQTYAPESMLLQTALNKDYGRFYRQQLEERRAYGFPPFRYLLKLTCSYARQASAKQAASKLAEQLRTKSGIEVVGPSPAFIERYQGRFRWQVVIKATNRSCLVEIIEQLPINWSYDLDPMNLL